MRIALVFRGYHYMNIPNFIYSDFEENLENFKQNLFDAYREQGHIIEVFCMTYNSEKLELML